MFCKRNRATIMISACIKRQDLIQEYKKLSNHRINDNEPIPPDLLKFKDFDITRLHKCLDCMQGRLIQENQDKSLDADVRNIIHQFYEKKPIRYKLKVKDEKKLTRYQLKVKDEISWKKPIRYQLKTLKI